MDEDLLWINEETERGPIDNVKAKLSAEFEGLPPDLCDDLQVCRFLRGHNNDPAEAAEFMGKAVAYRRELIEQEPYKSFRATAASATAVNIASLPHAAEISKVVPLRPMEGLSSEGLPVALASPKLIDFEGLSAVLASEDASKRLDEFLKAYMEHRALVLHNLSHAQQRMVKFFDLRDLTQANIPGIISSGFPAKMKGIISVLQHFYPETIHRLVVYSAPTAFSALAAILSSTLNARMQQKLKVFSRGTPFTDFCPLLDAHAIYSWTTTVTANISFKDLTVANGTQEFAAKWVQKGATCKWSLKLEDGSDVLLHRFFIPAPGAGDAVEVSKEEVTVTSGGTHEGSLTAACDGVMWFCIDNYSAWWHAKTVTLVLD